MLSYYLKVSLFIKNIFCTNTYSWHKVVETKIKPLQIQHTETKHKYRFSWQITWSPAQNSWLAPITFFWTAPQSLKGLVYHPNLIRGTCFIASWHKKAWKVWDFWSPPPQERISYSDKIITRKSSEKHMFCDECVRWVFHSEASLRTSVQMGFKLVSRPTR